MVALSWLMQQQKQRQKRGSERSQPAFFLLIADAGWAVHQTIDCSRLSEWFQTYILIICFIIGHYFSDDTRTQAHTLLLLLKIMVVHRERVLGVQHCSGRQVKVRKQPKRERERERERENILLVDKFSVCVYYTAHCLEHLRFGRMNVNWGRPAAALLAKEANVDKNWLDWGGHCCLPFCSASSVRLTYCATKSLVTWGGGGGSSLSGRRWSSSFVSSFSSFLVVCLCRPPPATAPTSSSACVLPATVLPVLPKHFILCSSHGH